MSTTCLLQNEQSSCDSHSAAELTEQFSQAQFDTPPSRFQQMIFRRLQIARKGMAEVQRYLSQGKDREAEELIARLEEDHQMLQRRVVVGE